MESENTKQIQVNHLVMMPMQDTMYQHLQQLAKPHVQQELGKMRQASPLVRMQKRVTIRKELLVELELLLLR